MGEIIVLDDTRTSRAEKLQILWRAYLNAKERAEQTHDIHDGIAAGKAWARWLSLFTEPAA
ncbi:hypothetical protein GCM10007989_07560 [Devosia pacifica]|uniref:Uncharacterized protein n=1 Tax=Devosia pacifica TaxID=1335967 RepID=A0A918RXZ1_9HYPH|nr:hypothetical protein [Devosia pacifica]GHA15283.1 hypothetical protein GCM10007989_07560 [Devosia pacifica]